MPRKIELKDKIFGKLMVLYQAKKPSHIISVNSFWNCLCKCGNTKIIRGTELINGKVSHCGCERNHPQETSISGIMKNYEQCDFNVFAIYSQLNCHYCGIKPFKRTNAFDRWPGKSQELGEFIYNGLDRIDSSKNVYDISNIVPCCFYCNCAKNTQSYFHFMNWINKLYINYTINNISQFNHENIIKIKCEDKAILRSAKRIWHGTYKEMTFDDFYRLSQEKCFYCHNFPLNKTIDTRFKGTEKYFIYNGIDRINSNIGHDDIKNVVPCCRWCNSAKLDRSVSDFYDWIKLTYHHMVEYKLFDTDINTITTKYIDHYNGITPSFPLIRSTTEIRFS